MWLHSSVCTILHTAKWGAKHSTALTNVLSSGMMHSQCDMNQHTEKRCCAPTAMSYHISATTRCQKAWKIKRGDEPGHRHLHYSSHKALDMSLAGPRAEKSIPLPSCWAAGQPSGRTSSVMRRCPWSFLFCENAAANSSSIPPEQVGRSIAAAPTLGRGLKSLVCKEGLGEQSLFGPEKAG